MYKIILGLLLAFTVVLGTSCKKEELPEYQPPYGIKYTDVTDRAQIADKTVFLFLEKTDDRTWVFISSTTKQRVTIKNADADMHNTPSFNAGIRVLGSFVKQYMMTYYDK